MYTRQKIELGPEPREAIDRYSAHFGRDLENVFLDARYIRHWPEMLGGKVDELWTESVAWMLASWY